MINYFMVYTYTQPHRGKVEEFYIGYTILTPAESVCHYDQVCNASTSYSKLVSNSRSILISGHGKVLVALSLRH